MGTDRKGPLAAFVVIAIVAAILLVTSVRSQAHPQWFPQDQVPATVVAAPPIGDPLRWAPVTTLGQVVEDGVVLAPKATSGATSAQVPSATPVAVTTYDGGVSTTTTEGTVTTHTMTVTRHHHAGHHARHHISHQTSHHTSHPTRHHTATATTATVTQADQAAAPLKSPQHGRHLGSSHVSGARPGHGHGRHLGWRHH